MWTLGCRLDGDGMGCEGTTFMLSFLTQHGRTNIIDCRGQILQALAAYAVASAPHARVSGAAVRRRPMYAREEWSFEVNRHVVFTCKS